MKEWREGNLKGIQTKLDRSGQLESKVIIKKTKTGKRLWLLIKGGRLLVDWSVLMS